MANIDLAKMINESIDSTMTKHDIPNTTENRIDVLMGMYTIIAKEGIVAGNDRLILQAMEDELVRLNDSLV